MEYNHPELNLLVAIQPGHWIGRIKKAYRNDAMAQTLAEGFGKNPRIGKDQGTYLWDGLIYVPTELREELI